MPALIHLRAATSADIPALHALDLLCFTEPFRFTLRAMRRFATQPNAIVLLAEASSTLVGFIILHLTGRSSARTAYIVTLDVHPALRRSGIARSLLEIAARQAVGDGAVSIHLHVSTQNQPAIHFYERLHFLPVAQVDSFYAPGLHALTYRKLLQPHPGERSSPEPQL